MAVRITISDSSLSNNKQKKLVSVCKKLLKDLGRNNETIHIEITDKQTIAQINFKYLKHKGPTDVITFSYNEYPEITCDILVCQQIAEEEAARWKISYFTELTRYVVHGILHHVGYTDKNPVEKKRMFLIQERYVNSAIYWSPADYRSYS